MLKYGINYVGIYIVLFKVKENYYERNVKLRIWEFRI